MHLDKFVHSKTGKIIMSLLLGLGLSTLFRAVCKGKKCRIIEAPPMEEISEQIFKFDDKCYKMEQTSVKCDSTKKIVII